MMEKERTSTFLDLENSERLLKELNPQFTDLDKFKKDLKEESKALLKQSNDAQSTIGMFEILPANEAIKQAFMMPDPLQLYPVLILENEFTILFADTGVGKTVFAMQIAIHISEKGKSVLFLDLELSKKQFQKRYTSESGELYQLPNTLYRVSFAKLNKVPQGQSYEEYFFSSLVEMVQRTGAKVIFLDNLTKLAAGDTDTAKAAIPILERLNQLKADYGLTIVVLEHNKKVDTSRPIQLNDLQGSKMKTNLVDAVFSIGRSALDKNLRYVKQVKVRDGETVYDTENVLLVEMSKEKGYLSLTEKGYANEAQHLKQLSEKNKTDLIEQVKGLSGQGKSQRQIATDLSISLGAVNKYLKM